MLELLSANSINISWLLVVQIYCYFEAVAQPIRSRCVINWLFRCRAAISAILFTGLLAKAFGLPVKRFIAAANANDTVPRFLSGRK